MDGAVLASLGLPGLFVAAFLAGSILPFPSEAVAAALVLGGVAPGPVVAVATAGNLLGAATLYAIGLALSRKRNGAAVRWMSRRLARDPQSAERALRRLRRWGAPLLLLSWMPFAGDALVVAAGLIGLRPRAFALYTGAGKALRYGAVVAAAALA